MRIRPVGLWPATLVVLVAVAALACGRRAESPERTSDEATIVKVTTIDIGRGVGPDRRVSEPTESFKPSDTIYASVVTEGSSENATLKARWTFENQQVVDEREETIAPSGGSVTEFHVSKPDGWPEGKYKLEVFLNGASAGTKDFEVRG